MPLKNDGGSIKNLPGDLARATTEAQWLAQIIRLAHDEGWEVHHVFEQRSYARRTGVGWPDLECLRERLMFIELKGFQKGGRRGALSPDQVRIIAMLKSAGQEVHVFWPDQKEEARQVFHRRTRAL